MTMTALYALTHQKNRMHRPSAWRLVAVDLSNAAPLQAAATMPLVRPLRGLASPRILVGACRTTHRAHADGRSVRCAAMPRASVC
jgi:hypothetical protein